MNRNTHRLNQRKPEVAVSYGLSADFDVTVNKLDADGNVISSRTPIRQCPNLITDFGMDLIGNYPIMKGTGDNGIAMSTYLSVGSGNTEPAFTDSALASKIAHVAGVGTGDGEFTWDTTDPDRAVLKRIYIFPVGAAAGAVSELGLHGASGGALTTRALFKDAFGDPTIIDVDGDEQLIVTYRIYFKPTLVDHVFITTQGATEYTITTRCAQIRSGLYANGVNYLLLSACIETQNNRSGYVTFYSGVSSGIGAVTGSPTGTLLQLGYMNTPNWTKGTYVNGNRWRDDSVTIPVGSGNVNNIGAILIEGIPFRLQVGISPRLNKTSLDTIKLTMRVSWARA